ncbi:TPA: hypothetical protein EYP70_02715 [Candidatus Bathyarchaeota archaeon]|nr:hypothetical protein [Candidatus Bathyarchaeota archaeon]
MMTEQNKELLKTIILVTGRDLEVFEAILANKQNDQKIEIINELLEKLKLAELKDEKFELMDRILLILGIPPMSTSFFERTFGNISFNDIAGVKERVDKIRCVYMLEFGNFYYGYRKLRDIDPYPIISKYFSSDEEKEKLIEHHRRMRTIPAFEDIPVGKRYCLGYLASKESKDINGYREKLIKVLEEGIKKGVKDPEELRKIAQNMGYTEWDEIVIRSAIEHSTDLLWWGTLFAGYSKLRYDSFLMLLQDAKNACEELNPQHIEKVREMGRRNTYAYLSTSDIDIYFATSMRKGLDFVSNARFLEEVIGTLKEGRLNLLYFDPTQSYLDDRIQKGLIESIMIKRCKIVVYNAQEQETFGKDAEAGIGLAHQKSVIIYVPRILPSHAKLKEFYDILDTVGYEKEPLGKALKDKGYLSEEQYYKFKAEETEKGEAIKMILGKSRKLNDIFQQEISNDDLKGELSSKGYDPTEPEIKEDVKKFSFEKMLEFETRALLFKDLHPLSFQVSPMDGIARGVFVTRTPIETARLIKEILLKSLEYKIIGEEEDMPNYLLRDKITNSPIRALPKDISLKIALSKLYEEEK